MRAAALEDRTDLPKGKNPQKQEECYQLLKSWPLASHLKHTPRDSPSFILYCLPVEDKILEGKIMDFGVRKTWAGTTASYLISWNHK